MSAKDEPKTGNDDDGDDDVYNDGGFSPEKGDVDEPNGNRQIHNAKKRPDLVQSKSKVQVQKVDEKPERDTKGKKQLRYIK